MLSKYQHAFLSIFYSYLPHLRLQSGLLPMAQGTEKGRGFQSIAGHAIAKIIQPQIRHHDPGHGLLGLGDKTRLAGGDPCKHRTCVSFSSLFVALSFSSSPSSKHVIVTVFITMHWLWYRFLYVFHWTSAAVCCNSGKAETCETHTHNTRRESCTVCIVLKVSPLRSQFNEIITQTDCPYNAFWWSALKKYTVTINTIKFFQLPIYFFQVFFCDLNKMNENIKYSEAHIWKSTNVHCIHFFLILRKWMLVIMMFVLHTNA